MSTQSQPAMTNEEYFAADGFSASGMKDFAVSPFRYWHLHVNPERPPEDEPTPALRFGQALHCAVLEPDRFDARYACEVDAADHPGCLVTIEDIRAWIRSHGVEPKGNTRALVIAMAQKLDPSVPILELIEKQHREANEGKTLLSKDEWTRLAGAAVSLRSEPKMRELLRGGKAEVVMFAKDPETGVLLKAKMDWVTPKVTVDLKTFTQQRSKSIDKAIADAIFFEGYYRQAWLYTYIRSILAAPERVSPDFVIPFVESEEPFETRIKVLRPTTAGQPNIYWMRAQAECMGMIRRYAEYMKEFGKNPWRYALELDPLIDEDIPALAY